MADDKDLRVLVAMENTMNMMTLKKMAVVVLQAKQRNDVRYHEFVRRLAERTGLTNAQCEFMISRLAS